jgi:hypothetical protein
MNIKPNSPVFVFNVNNDFDHASCEHAILNMSQKYRDELIQMMNSVALLKSFNSSVYRLELWDGYQVQYLRTYEAEDEDSTVNSMSDELISQLENLMVGSQIIQVETEVEFDLLSIRFECPTAIVDENSVMFDCIIKHSNVRLYTESISRETLLALDFSS